jgi:hypothetical protein
VRWRTWTENLGAKILSFVVAVGLWYSVTNRLEFEDTVEFPVEYVNRPEGLTTVESLPQTVKAHVRGKGKFLRYTLRDGVCRVDLSGYQIGPSRIDFTGEDVVLPQGVTVSRVEISEPKRVTVEFDETVVRDVAIVPAVVGTPDEHYVQVGRTVMNPARARVKGPRKLVDEIALLHTSEIDIDGKKSLVRKRVRLVPPESPTVEVTPLMVDVAIQIEQLVTRRIENVALRAGGAPGAPAGPTRVHFDPPQVAVEIEGARSIVEVATKDPTELPLQAKSWVIGGRSILTVKELHGAEITFAPASDSPAGPAAASGDVTAHLALPPDVEILSIDPDRFSVYVGTGGPPRGRNEP